MLSIVFATLLASAQPVVDTQWHNQLTWREQNTSMSATPDGGFVLHTGQGDRAIGKQPMAVYTASALFDGLFAMAQDDLRLDSVSAIRDDAFDHGQPIPCHCFETGAKWHYVWTRDLSYSVDLSLWQLDPERAMQSLRFKLSGVREPTATRGLYVMQDTGSGGSWPISTDRIVWFLGARHLLGNHAFSDDVWHALIDTLAQDRQYIFDNGMGLYRGETSFLDWREQSYPAWTAQDVMFIAQSFSLSTNVLHYQALQLAAAMAAQRHDPKATVYRQQSEALKSAINARFWRRDRGMYMSYIGGDGMPFEAYDLLGLSLAITSGVADAQRARASLANYPAYAAGSPVIWPERADQPIYHNRAIWPFVTAYALRAARVVDDPIHIEQSIRSLMRGATLSGSNMENFELTTQSTHVDDGPLSGPVVDSPRQLWSVAGYIDMVAEGVFGVTGSGDVQPKLPVSLVPMLFGQSDRIRLQWGGRDITLLRPSALDGDLLVAASVGEHGKETVVKLKAVQVVALPLRDNAPLFAPATPTAPVVKRIGDRWRIDVQASGMLYVDGQRNGAMTRTAWLPHNDADPCFSMTTTGANGVESLPSLPACTATLDVIRGTSHFAWRAPASGRYRIALIYANANGPINTGITAAVKQLSVQCDDGTAQTLPMVMPHSVGTQASTTAAFSVHQGARCQFALQQGFNMSYLSHNAHYTGGRGGIEGSVNTATVSALSIVRIAGAAP